MNNGCGICRFNNNEPWDDPCYKCRKGVNNEWKPKNEEPIEKSKGETMNLIKNIRIDFTLQDLKTLVASYCCEQGYNVEPKDVEINVEKDDHGTYYLSRCSARCQPKK